MQLDNINQINIWRLLRLKILEVRNLRKTFKLSKKQQRIAKTADNIKVAVDNVSFRANPGEILGILGANGAGKTTTLRMLAAIINADSGEILLDGKEINEDIISYRKKIGFLTSELKLEDFFTPNYLFDFFMNRLVIFFK